VIYAHGLNGGRKTRKEMEEGGGKEKRGARTGTTLWGPQKQ